MVQELIKGRISSSLELQDGEGNAPGQRVHSDCDSFLIFFFFWHFFDSVLLPMTQQVTLCRG